MAKVKDEKKTDVAASTGDDASADTEPKQYTERMLAKVNAEGNQHEVILRGEKSTHTLILRNALGAKSVFEDGKLYTVTVAESTEE